MIIAICSVEADGVDRADIWLAAMNGNVVELCPANGATDREMIDRGYIRVTHPGLNGIETQWGDLDYINAIRAVEGLPAIAPEDISE